MEFLLVAHDAGGAELVSSWARRHPENKYTCLLGGPAEAIFRKKGASFATLDPEAMPSAMPGMDFVLTATSASSRLETSALDCARRNKVRSAAFLDYWWGFKTRFERDESLHLPDELWVADEYARRMAEETFPDLPVVLQGNPYLADMADEKRKFPPRAHAVDGLSILYLCQPINEAHADGNGAKTLVNDVAALRYFLELAGTRLPHPGIPLRVRIRLHPSESGEKYAGLAREFPGIPITISGYAGLVEDLANADWAIGLYTMALVVAVYLGTPAFACLPPGARPLSRVLPFEEIRDFHTLLTPL